MSGTVYDVDVVAVQGVLSQAGGAALMAGAVGRAAAADGDQISGLCGSASGVAAAFSRLWSTRRETGPRSAAYGAGCASAVDQACQALAAGDAEMADRAGQAQAQAASVARFSGRGA
ncbi:hypothetical protein GCM10027061_25850 [Nesterenkonia suensis]